MALPDVVVTDADLVARVRRGEEAAFEQIYREHHGALCAWALRWVRSPALAEEVVQEVFLRIWWRRADWVLGSTLAAYLFTAVRNGSLNRVRAERLGREWEERTRAEVAALPSPPSAEPADHALREGELARAIDAAVAELAPRCRETFLLRRKHNLSYVEIAEIMGVSPKTVEVQIGLALKALRKRLEAWL
jgi:RNA polymerase sigma-70 factor, ECF subfamily